MELAFYLETAILMECGSIAAAFFLLECQHSVSPGSHHLPKIDFHADTLESSHA